MGHGPPTRSFPSYWYLERAEYPLGTPQTTPTVRLFATLERRDTFRPLIVVRVFWRAYGPMPLICRASWRCVAAFFRTGETLLVIRCVDLDRPNLFWRDS